MTDREYAQPPDRDQHSWPLADASQRHSAGASEPRTDQPAPGPQPTAQPGPSVPPAGSGFAPPFPPGSGPYAQPTAAFQRPGQPYGPGFPGGPYAAPGHRPAPGYAPTGPLGLPAPGAYAQTTPGAYTQTAPGAHAQTTPAGRATKRIAIVAGVLALMLSSGVVGGVAATRLDNEPVTSASTRAPAVATAQTGSLADVVSAFSPSVVSINVAVRGGAGSGSGVIIDPDGTILTNAHVVSGATRIQVVLADGRRLDARLLGADTDADVALIRVENAGTLTAASLATDTTVRVGDTVLAFGSPLGLEGSVTAGIVSSVDREVEGRSSTMAGMIQTDAAINPGNSGGPLVNTSGQVVGMNTAIATTSENGGNIGVGFAIPIDKAMQVANQLRSG